MTRNTTDEPLVPVFEIAARLGTVEEVLLARLNGQVRTDWAGRPAVTIATARAVVEEVELARHEHEEAEAERLAAERAAQVQRQSAFERYYAEELQRERERVMGELMGSNTTFVGLDPLSPADRRRALERARARVEREGKR
jgi:hypothetical protein